MSVLVDSVETPSTSRVSLSCVCGQSDLEDLGPCRPPCTFGLTQFEASLSLQVAAGRLYRCRRCFLGQRLPRPDQAKLDQLYSAMSADRWTGETPLSCAQQLIAQQCLRSATNSNFRVLDVGAFVGKFLDALPAGFQKFAIEPSAGGQEELKKKGICVLKPFLETAGSKECQQFDLVTMFDVFEHLTDPIDGVRALMSNLKPGGRLVLGTADLDHWSWKATRGFHWYLDPIQHISVGSGKHFEWLRSQLPPCTLKTTSVSHQSGSFSDRLQEASQVVYFGARQREGIARAAVRLLHLVPCFRRLSHKDAVPYTQKLRDHIVAEFVSLECDR